MSKENEKISGNHLPSENELLFETWKQITQFMEEVKKVYLKFNFSIEESSLKAVEWGDKIFNRPEQVKKIIQQEWPLHLKELKINYLISDTQDKLERSGVPSSIAHEYAQKYAQEMVEVEKKSGILAWISGQNKIINAAKNNLQNLAGYVCTIAGSPKACQDVPNAGMRARRTQTAKHGALLIQLDVDWLWQTRLQQHQMPLVCECPNPL